MQFIKRLLIAALALGLMAPGLSYAGATAPYRMANIYAQGYAEASPGQTFNSTTYADLASTPILFTPTQDPAKTGAPGTPATVERAHILWFADVSKATATTGSCAIFVNGAVIASTERFVASAGGRDTIGGFLDVQVVGAVTQTIKLQCRSADTNVLTVNNASIYVEEFAA